MPISSPKDFSFTFRRRLWSRSRISLMHKALSCKFAGTAEVEACWFPRNSWTKNCARVHAILQDGNARQFTLRCSLTRGCACRSAFVIGVPLG